MSGAARESTFTIASAVRGIAAIVADTTSPLSITESSE
jgi:hypothetical protein